MSWLVLVLAGFAEAVWALALDRSDGFRSWQPSVVFVVALGLSMAGLAYAMRSLPVGTAYAVWVGIGAAITIAYSMLTGAEVASPWRILFLAMIVGGVIGLKVVA
ncbi:MAG: QacE family quaternary ammonium compound efflux SMR transporter [Actinobacteria bacterium]|nr:QacE family quaternary ammonium compound efflux SMR transporter [Actinomycetota bacterium]